MSQKYLGLDNTKKLTLSPNKGHKGMSWVVFAIFMLLPFFCMLAYFFANHATNTYIKKADANFEKYMRLEAQAQAASLSNWLESASSTASRVTKSRTIQSFIQQVNEQPSINGELPKNLQVQKSLISEMLSTFAHQNNFSGVSLINRRAQNVVSSAKTMGLAGDYEERSRDVFKTYAKQYGKTRMNLDKLVVDLYVPIKVRQIQQGQEKISVVGVLTMAAPVGEPLQKIFKQSSMALTGEISRVFEKSEKGIPALILFEGKNKGIYTQDKTSAEKKYKALWRLFSAEKQGKHDLRRIPQFGQTGVLPRVGEVLMYKTPVQKSPYIIMSVLNLQEAYEDVFLFRKQTHIISQLCAIMLFIVLLTVWLKFKSSRQKAVAEAYHSFADTVNTQRNLLVNINNAVKEHITLKYFDGHYIYANPSFSSLFDMQPDETIGKRDKDFFDEKIVEEFKEMEAQVRQKQEPVYAEKTFKINGKKYSFEISKSPFIDTTGTFVGITTIARDISELFEARELQERFLKNAMRALTIIMKKHDAYITKHAKYLTHISKALGEKMGLKKEDLSTLEICATLGQIGKIFVDAKILKMPKYEMDDETLERYLEYIETSAYVLDSVDWRLPVVKTVYAMHEKLDGSGYPNGLKGDDISRLARVLCVCDAFCAMTAPKHGEEHFTPEAAIKNLAEQKDAYDITVVQQLAEMISQQEDILMLS